MRNEVNKTIQYGREASVLALLMKVIYEVHH
jgi:hypothetical protein